MSRRVHVDVVARLDMASRMQRGRLTIDRDHGVVMVRPHRRRRVYTMGLDAMASIIVARVIAAELAEKRAAKKARRRG